MNQYQDQTKKKPLIPFTNKMKYNQPTIAIKEKIKKDKSIQKQNVYEIQTKKFKDFNQSKYQTQYQTQNNVEMFKKPIPTSQVLPLTPSNMQMNNNISNKNLTFGIVKNTQKGYMGSMVPETEIPQPNSYISVNVNIQNVPQPLIDYNKKNVAKYEIKPVNLKRNIQNERINQQHFTIHNQRNGNVHNQRNLKIDEQKRRINNTITTTQRFMQRPSIMQRMNTDKNLERNDRNEKKDKFKKQFQEKYILTTSPTVDKQFMCEEELDIKPMDKKPLLYEKKPSEKKLNVPQVSQHCQIQTQPQNHMIQTATINQPPLAHQPLIAQTRFPKKVQRKPLDIKECMKELKQFEIKEDEINSATCAQAIEVLFSQQEQYMVDPTYLQKGQKAINWTIRAILIDWMRQLSHQYALKRDTYHLAVVLLDNFLAKKPNIQKQVAQVIGATTLFIASKLQELECRPSQSFAQSTQGICTAKDIQLWEIQICKTLEFKLNPPTIYALANRIMKQWDKYIDEVDYAMHHPCFEGKEKSYFKKLDQNSYRMFRQLMQFIDCVILDVQTAQYKPILIVLSVMYLILGIRTNGFQFDQIHQVFPRVSNYLVDRNNYFNDLFEKFVESSFGMTLLEILPSVQYTATFFNLTLTYEKPLLGQNEDQLDKMELEEYCSYQTYNRHMLKTVTSRFRGIMNTF